MIAWIKTNWFKLAALCLWLASVYQFSRVATALARIGGISGHITVTLW
jgi:hypothetical protein